MSRMYSLPRLVAVIVIVSLVVLPSAAAPVAPAVTSPTLGSAESYSVLSGAIVTNTGPSVISGDVGASPSIGVPLHVTGFPPGIINAPGAIHDSDANAGLAQADATAAFLALSAAPNTLCTVTFSADQSLSGMTLSPGIYCFPTSAQLTTGVTLTLDGGGDAAATWIFRMGSTLITTPGVNATVIVTNAGLPCNVWWKVVSSATIGSGTHFIGNIMALTSISLGTGAILEGRALAQTGAVTLDSNTISAPNCAPTAVELLSFQATPLSGHQVDLTWTTAVEVDNFGFNLYRAAVNDLAHASLIHFEPAVTQGSGTGATYSYIDTTPGIGKWWYWLADVDTRGHETVHAPINVTAQFNTRLYLPVIAR